MLSFVADIPILQIPKASLGQARKAGVKHSTAGISSALYG